jgi:hypothetical protein
MPSLTDGEVVQNFQSRALKLGRELESVRRDNAERERELFAAEKVSACILSCSLVVPVLMIAKVLALAHSQHVRLQAETDPLIRSFEEASDALKDGDAAYSSILMR